MKFNIITSKMCCWSRCLIRIPETNIKNYRQRKKKYLINLTGKEKALLQRKEHYLVRVEDVSERGEKKGRKRKWRNVNARIAREKLVPSVETWCTRQCDDNRTSVTHSDEFNLQLKTLCEYTVIRLLRNIIF